MKSMRSRIFGPALWLGSGLLWVVLAGSALAGGAETGESVVRGEAPVAKDADQEILDRVLAEGYVRVIVQFAIPYAPEAELSSVQVLNQRARIEAAQDQLLGDLWQQGEFVAEESVRRFRFVPGMALTVSGSALGFLQQHPQVLSIAEDRLDRPMLYDTISLTGTNTAWNEGYSGVNQAVAVLDTGVNKNHPFFSGKVVAEACFSSNTSESSSLCPGGVESSTAPNSGLDCTGAAGCGHGTHVAGIAAGRNGASNQGTIHGVGRDASVIAIQVFSEFSGSVCTGGGGSSPCVLSWGSDQIAALEHVYSLRNNFSIAVSNMSLGGGSHSSHCDSDPRKPIIDLLRSAGIATVIASGNNGFTNAIGAPACISTAVSVGSSTKNDFQSAFNNVASILDLMAPGSSICSAVNSGGNCGSGFSLFSGTSMAAPHVAGAWAVLKSYNPNATVSEIKTALQDTGTPITTEVGPKPRINVDLAMEELNGGGPPPDTSSRLFNISTRGHVGTGAEVLIGGFVLQGNDPGKVLIRARGPSLPDALGNQRLVDPMVRIYSGQTVIAENDNWREGGQESEIIATGRQPPDDREAAVLMTLNPGPYTAIVTGVSGTTGIGIIEVLDIALDNP